MRKERNTARAGHKGCRCCYPLPDSSTLRKRERLMWLQDSDDREGGQCDDVESGNV
jgi:hypothetical protein